MTGGPEAALAGSVFTVGRNRLAFGMIDADGKFVYGKSAVYVAPSPGAKARGPYPAPADLLITDPPFRSKQAATETDPFSAVYAAAGAVHQEGPVVGADRHPVGRRAGGRADPAQGRRQGRGPDPGRSARPAPKVQTDTIDSAKGDEEKIDTRRPARARAAPRVVRRRGRQEAGRAAVLHAAAVPVARLRAGDRHRAADEGEVRLQDGLHPSGGLRRQRPQQGPARAAAALRAEDRAVAVRGRQAAGRSARGSRARSA